MAVGCFWRRFPRNRKGKPLEGKPMTMFGLLTKQGEYATAKIFPVFLPIEKY